jgi:hypothetical protein
MAENHLLEDGRLVYAKGHTIGMRSGSMAGIASNGVVAGVRNLVDEPLVVAGIMLAAYSPAAFTAAQAIAFDVHRVDSFTSSLTGGLVPVSQRKRTADHAVMANSEVELMVANAAALGNAPSVTANSPLFTFSCNVDAVGAAGLVSGDVMWYPPSKIPITLGRDQGLVVVNSNGFGAGGVVLLTLSLDVLKA